MIMIMIMIGIRLSNLVSQIEYISAIIFKILYIKYRRIVKWIWSLMIWILKF